MSALTLILKSKPEFEVDMSPLTPDQLVGKRQSQIKSLKLKMGKRQVAVSDLFDVTGKDTSDICIRKSCQKLVRIGSGMSDGRIDVSGRTGDWLGKDMRGGYIIARANAGNWVGSGMTGGRIDIKGSVGDYLGAGAAGQPFGMNDGLILVSGNSGDRVGDRMRRGTIIIQGDTGNFCGSRMIAGSIVVMGKIGNHTGYGMRRGTIILKKVPQQMLATFQSCGLLKMEYLRLFFKQLSSMGRAFTIFKLFGPEVIRYAGDLANQGQGEILILQNIKNR